MRDRVTELGGLLTVESGPGEGTRVRACFPLGAPSRTGDGPTGEGAEVEGVTEEVR
jgi:signal transduction histidine kinase